MNEITANNENSQRICPSWRGGQLEKRYEHEQGGLS